MQASFVKVDAEAVGVRGMEKANTLIEMRRVPSHLSPTAPLSRGMDMPGGTVPEMPVTPGAATDSFSVPAPVPSAAARLVEHVGEVAERLSERSSDHVKISVDLAGDQRVEVKIALRDGRVFADFRAESGEMRAALVQAWDGFVRSQDGAGQRWAEPVFSANGESSSRTDGQAGQQQSAPRREAPNGEPAFSLVRPSSAPAASTAPVSSVAAAAARVDGSRHLSALA